MLCGEMEVAVPYVLQACRTTTRKILYQGMDIEIIRANALHLSASRNCGI